MRKSEPLAYEDHADWTFSIGRLIGQRLHSVGYVDVELWDELGTASTAETHNVGMDIRLTFGSTDLEIAWASHGVDQGLQISGRFGSVGDTFEFVDVSSTGLWLPHINAVLIGAKLHFHVPEEGARTSLWAIELLFDSSASAIGVMLGSLKDELKYEPDSLLVISGLNPPVRKYIAEFTTATKIVGNSTFDSGFAE